MYNFSKLVVTVIGILQRHLQSRYQWKLIKKKNRKCNAQPRWQRLERPELNVAGGIRRVYLHNSYLVMYWWKMLLSKPCKYILQYLLAFLLILIIYISGECNLVSFETRFIISLILEMLSNLLRCTIPHPLVNQTEDGVFYS